MYDIFLAELSLELFTIFHVRYGKSVDECRIWEFDKELYPIEKDCHTIGYYSLVTQVI